MPDDGALFNRSAMWKVIVGTCAGAVPAGHGYDPFRSSVHVAVDDVHAAFGGSTASYPVHRVAKVRCC